MNNDIKIINPKDFRQMIIEFAEVNNIDYMDSILHFAECYKLEIETVAKLLDQDIKDKLKKQAKKLNLVK